MRLATLIALPVVISATGQYVTRRGEVVTIAHIHKGWADGRHSDGTPEKWDVSGRLLPFSESQNDIVGMVSPLNLKELRQQFPFKPFEYATIDGRTVECVSYPFPDDPRPVGIMVRMTPGDPETMQAVEASRLQPVGVGSIEGV